MRVSQEAIATHGIRGQRIGQRNDGNAGIQTNRDDGGTANMEHDQRRFEPEPLEAAQHEWRKVLKGTTDNSARRTALPMTDAISNSRWGDECTEKEGNIFRTYAQNVNGLSLDRRGGQYDTLCKVLREAQVDVFLGQEHNLDSTQYKCKKHLA
jgi:hypothetical protein